MKSKSLSHDKKHRILLIEIGGHWYVGKMTKGLSTIKKKTLGNKAQEKYDENKWKLHTSDRNRNDW